MKRSGDQALDQALAFHRAPGYLAAIRRRALPENLETLLRIVAGESEAGLQAAQSTGESPDTLREVAIFYIQQLLFADDSDSYRVLGVNPDAADEQIKSHYRWLVRWLHPDRNPDAWESVFADRVNSAWQDLRTPDRRNAYDLKRTEHGQARTESHEEFIVNRDAPDDPPPLLSTRTVQWLPTISLAAVALLAVAGLLLFQQSQIKNSESVATAVPPAAQSQSNVLQSQPPVVAATTMPTPGPSNQLPNPISTMEATSQAEPLPPATTAIAVATVTNSTTDSKSPVIDQHSLQLAPATARPTNAVVRIVPPEPEPKATAERMLVATPPAKPTQAKPRDAIAVAPSLVALPPPRPIAIAAPMNVNVVSLQPAQLREAIIRPETSTESALIDERIAASLVSRFSQAYAEGDTEQLMQLFTHDAQNAHGDRRAIAEDYRRLFETSERRRIALRDLSWLAVGDSATIIASFESEVVPRGKTRGERSTGDIRFDLRQENGELRIYRLRHDNRRS